MNRDKIKKWVIGIFLFFFLAYGLFESSKLLSGPKLEILEPENGQYFETPLVNVRGKAKHISFISLNDKAIFIDTEGNFSEKLILSPGYNIMSLKAKDRFGKSIEKKLEFFLKRPENTLIDESIFETATSSEAMATPTASTTIKVESGE